MADTSSCPGMTVYRLRVVIAGISPLIWRRLEVAAGTTVAGLHAIVQTVFGWSGGVGKNSVTRGHFAELDGMGG